MKFRAGVVAIVTNSAGLVLAFERSDVPGQWQLPQGGIAVGETPDEAAWRELEEETALSPADVELIGEFPEWTVYEWPADVRARTGRPGRDRFGQAQRWFTFRVHADDVVPTPDGVEFSAWQWVDRHWLIEQVVEFRRPVYERVLGRPVALDDPAAIG